MEEQPQRTNRETSFVGTLENAIGENEGIQALMDEFRITSFSIVQKPNGIFAVLQGAETSSEKNPALHIPLTITPEDDIDMVILEMSDALLRFFKRPIIVETDENRGKISNLTSKRGADEQKVYETVKRYDGTSALSYTTLSIWQPKDFDEGNGANEEAFHQWMKNVKAIQEYILENMIVAFWWEENELHIVGEKNVEENVNEKVCVYNELEKIVARESMEQILREYGIDDRVIIVESIKDLRLDRDREHTKESSLKNQWDSPLRGSDCTLSADKNGLLRLTDEFAPTMDVLRGIAEKNPLAIFIKKNPPDDEDDGENDEHTWKVRIFDRIIDPEENDDRSISAG